MELTRNGYTIVENSWLIPKDEIYISLCRYGYNIDSHIHDKFRLISLNIKLPDTAIINSVSNKLDYFRVDATSIDSCTHSTFNLFLASYRVFFKRNIATRSKTRTHIKPYEYTHGRLLTYFSRLLTYILMTSHYP